MDLSIVIVNWNGGDLLIRCLDSIRASKSSFPVKVIVVDNDSSDGSREMAASEFPEFHVFNSGGNLGFGRANNLAKPLVDTSLVLFLNPDTELAADTLEIAVRCLTAHREVGALGCKMRYPSGQVQQQGLQWNCTPGTVLLEMLLVNKSTVRAFKRWLPLIDPEKSAFVRKIYGGFVLARKEVMDQAGWFDERYFMYAEDADLCRTIRRSGWKLYYCSEAEIIHVSGGASAGAPSGFSILMKHDSINKLILKYNGRIGALLHRGFVFLGALFRLCALGVVRAVSWVFRSRESNSILTGSIFKQRLMLLWSLGLKKPVVAASPARQASREAVAA